MVTVQQRGDLCEVRPSGEMTIYQVSALAQELLPRLGSEEKLVIDLADVSEIDSSGVQLLMLAKKQRAQSRLAFSLINHSRVVVEVFDQLGLVAWFNDPVVLAAESARGKNRSSVQRERKRPAGGAQ